MITRMMKGMKTDYSTEFLELVEDMKKDGIMLLTPIASIAGYYIGKKFITIQDGIILMQIENKIMNAYKYNRENEKR